MEKWFNSIMAIAFAGFMVTVMVIASVLLVTYAGREIGVFPEHKPCMNGCGIRGCCR